MNYFLLLFFGLAPSLLWLLYFLRKDVHPEDNRQVLRIFLFGFVAVAPAALVQLGFLDLLGPLKGSLLGNIIILFLGVALTEEVFKYWVVRDKILNTSEIDEPTDLPLFLIISALGFAAAENLLLIAGPPLFAFSPLKTLAVTLYRGLSAIFLHALASGTLGLFLAAGFYRPREKNKLLIEGLVLAVFLHGLYDFSIMEVEGAIRFVIPFLILLNLALVLSIGFKKLRELKSICQVE